MNVMNRIHFGNCIVNMYVFSSSVELIKEKLFFIKYFRFTENVYYINI